MKINQTLSLGLILLFACKFTNAAGHNPTDSTLSKIQNVVKIGPPDLNLPPLIIVDSALVRKLAVEDFLKKKNSEESDFIHYQNMQVLHSLVSNLEIDESASNTLIESLGQALQDAERTGNLKAQATIMNAHAVFYAKKDDLESSISYFKSALTLKEKLSDKIGAASIASTLTEIYKIKQDYPQAIIYGEYAAKIYTSLKKKKELAEIYANMGLIKNLQNRHAEAEIYILRKALPLYQSIGSKQGRMSCFEHLAEIYFLQNKLSQAKWFCIQANLMAIKLEDKQSQMSALISLGSIKNANGEYDLALEDFKAAALLASENKYEMALVEIKGNLGETYGYIGDYRSAGNELQEYARLKDALLSSANVKYN